MLRIPNYSFDWQESYRWTPDTMRFPKGTVLDVLAHFDNSAFNPYNPDPHTTVSEGPQTHEEMMYGFVFFTRDDEHLDLRIDPGTGTRWRSVTLSDERAQSMAVPMLPKRTSGGRRSTSCLPTPRNPPSVKKNGRDWTQPRNRRPTP